MIPLSARSRDAVAVVAIAATALTLGILASSIAYDDAWITYRYAFNFATGQGLVYNAGERFLGTTGPGMALLLGLVCLPAPEMIPTAAATLCVLGLTAIGLGLFTYARIHGHPLGGLLAALFFVASPVSTEAFGGEMLPQAALVVWAFIAQLRGRSTLAVALATAATVLRPDGLIALGLIGLHQAWTTRRLPWRQMAIAGAVLGIWFGGLWIYYGWPLPQTLAAKHAQRVSRLWRELGTDLVLWFKALTIHGTVYFLNRPAPGFTAFVYLAGLGVLALPWFRFWWVLFTWPVMYLLVYRQLHMPFYHWYAVPPLIVLAASASAAAEGLAALLQRLLPAGRRAGPAPAVRAAEALVTVLALAVIIVPLARFTARNTTLYPSAPEIAYVTIGRWLDARAPADASFGYLEIGRLGYYARRTVIDPLGLVNPGVAPHVARRDFLWAYRRHRPTYIVHNPAFFPEYLGIVLDEPWFRQDYRPIASFESGRPEPIVVYRRSGG